MPEPLLGVRDLRIRMPGPRGPVTIVEDVEFEAREGEVTGIAGESGSGKTLTALSLLGLQPATAVVTGEARFAGRDLLRLTEAQLLAVRGGEIGVVFQDPMTSLHPMLRIGSQVSEHMSRHLGVGRAQALRRAAALLEQVRIPDPEKALHAYPHQFSGGMRQRIMIAMALACEPRLLIADEPTTALDVTVQAGILRLLDGLCRERGMAVLLVTHDLGVMSAVSHRLMVMYAGRVVESGNAQGVLARPRHPYTAQLQLALPSRSIRRPLTPISGTPATPHDRPPGCAFHPRCPYAEERCTRDVPPLEWARGERAVACHIRPFDPPAKRAGDELRSSAV